MSKYLYLYRGPATPMDQFTEEQSAEQMQAWGVWMGRVGSALTDGGAPFGERAAVADDGATAATTDLNGYTIVEADSLEAARGLLDGHPFLSEGKGRFTSRSSSSCPWRCTRRPLKASSVDPDLVFSGILPVVQR